MTGRLPRVLTLFGVLVAAAGITAGSTVLPAGLQSTGSVTGKLPRSLSTPALVCPGPETLLVPDGGEPIDSGGSVLYSSLVAASSSSSSSGSASARLKLFGGPSDAMNQTAVTLPAGAPALTTGASLKLDTGAVGTTIKVLAGTALGPAVLTSTSANSAPSLAAVQSTLARSGNLRALVATACTAPDSDSWLVGGATVSGERLRLLLANPASSPAVVDIDVLGPDGRVPAPSGEGVVVPAGREVPIFIDALAPGLDRVAVHVTTRSGRVRATLHDSLLRGLAPGGADDVPAAAAAAKQQVVPGVSLVNGYAKSADDPAAAGSTSVRVAVPGSEEAVVRVQLLDSSGAVELPRAAVVNVPAGGVADVPISGIPSGTYTAIVDADVPVVAGARIGRGDPAAAVSEFGWAAAARRLSGSGYAVLPPGTNSTLSLVAPKGTGQLEAQEVRYDGTLAAPANIEVQGGSSATVQLDPTAVAVKLSDFSGGPVAASIVATAADPGGPLISVLSVDLVVAAKVPATGIEDPDLGLR
jgi:Family of unknown function (DUF5719)